MAYLKMNFVSACLSRSVSVSLLLPSGKVEELSTIANEGYKKGAPMKVIYLLGGIMEDESGWCINSRLPSYAEEHDYLIVMPNGEGKGYINQGKDRFYDFISKETPPLSNRVSMSEAKKKIGSSPAFRWVVSARWSTPSQSLIFGAMPGRFRHCFAIRSGAIRKPIHCLWPSKQKKNARPCPKSFTRLGRMISSMRITSVS